MDNNKGQIPQADNKRIAKNSIFMTIRMFVVMLISIYTTRVILEMLGVEDYGIYNVVCGFVSMFAFLNSSMASATQRFYNFELGKNGINGVRKVYNASLKIHLILAIITIFATEVFGLWYLHNKLVIPSDRLFAANWIFQFSVISLFLNILNVPYSSVIMAYEKMDYYAIIGVIDAVLKLLIVLLLPLFIGDRLIIYGALFLLITTFNFLAYLIYAKKKIPHLTLGVDVEKPFFKEMLSFAGWNLFGSFAYMMRDQGINLVLNSFFGPIVNAARGIAAQVNGALNGFSVNILVPARPQIVQSYAQGNYERSFHLMYSISKLTCVIFLLMSLPIALEINTILSVWLGNNIPEHTASFIIIMLITSTWGSLVAPVSAVVHATGKMKFYQILSSASNILSVPLAYLFLICDAVPEYVFIALFITMITNHIAGLISLKRLTVFSIKDYAIKVMLPLFVVIILSFSISIIPYIFISNKILNFCVVTIVSVASVSLLSIIIALDKEEKLMLNQIVNKFIKR